jgi:hypothetical protein
VRTVNGVMAGTAVAALVVLGTACPAHAEKFHHKDASGDASVVTSSSTTPAPTAAAVDIHKLKVDYSHHSLKLSVKVGVVALITGPPTVDPGDDPSFRLKDANGKDWTVSVHELNGPPTVTLLEGTQSVPCAGLTVTADTVHATWRVHLPASCIGTPDWVKPGVQMWEIGKYATIIDDGLKTGPSPYDLTPKVGAKVHRN